VRLYLPHNGRDLPATEIESALPRHVIEIEGEAKADETTA
jgi:hypothetical protein